jgi:branched-subunit amino acid aminotransferase/4-amino-4-deoxychorismate lyase
MRAVVLREAAQCGLHVHVASLPLSAVDECDGMFLTNARLGPVPVHELNGRSLKVDDRVRALAAQVDMLER